jgi:hypothetical protein
MAFLFNGDGEEGGEVESGDLEREDMAVEVSII